MTDMTIIEDMDALEAEACLIAIQGNLDEAARLTSDFDRRNGWKALRYPNLRACLESELEYSRSYVWRLEQAAQVAASIQDALPDGSRVIAREGTIRNSGIKELPSGIARAEAYTIAHDMAAAEGTRLTALHLKNGVEQVKARNQIFSSRYTVITHLVVTGDITVAVGNEINQIMEKLPPRKRGYLMELMAKFKLTCPALFVPIADLFERPPGKESLVLPEILTGFLAGVPLAAATVTDLKRANYAAQQQHFADNEEKRRTYNKQEQPVYVTLSLPIGNLEKTQRILRRELGEAGFDWLHRMMLGV